MKIKKPKPLAPTMKVAMPLPSMERTHHMIAKFLGEGEFDNIEDLNARLRQLTTSGALDRTLSEESQSPAEQAQELAYRAMEEPKSAKAGKLAEQALALDPDCVDALVIRAQTRKLDHAEYIAELLSAVAAGEKTIGEKEFAQLKGHFWLAIETRPYMRARNELAMGLRIAGKYREAADEFEEMLELNPGDNQGVRDYLLGVYLALEDTDAAASLMRQYEDESAVFAWGRVILRMLQGKRREARAALTDAFKINPWTLFPFIKGPVDPVGPTSWGIGDDDEAEHAASALAPAVEANPDTLIWIVREAQALLAELQADDAPVATKKSKRVN